MSYNYSYDDTSAAPGFNSQGRFSVVDGDQARGLGVGFGQDYSQPASRSDVRDFGSSLTGLNDRGQNSAYVGAQTHSALAHKNYSDTSAGNTYGEKSAPGFTGIRPDNRSETGDVSVGGETNQADYVGISLVGKKFKEVNPTAYYVEK